MKAILFAMVLLPALLLAQSQSENFILTKSVIDAGGGASSSENFNQVSAFGQPTPLGAQTSENFVLYAGFLTPQFSVSPLSPIQELTIHPVQPDIVLDWEAIPTATEYKIHRSTTAIFTPGPANLIGTTSNTTFTDTNAALLPATENFYYVIAVRP